jgi:hypothetical protein
LDALFDARCDGTPRTGGRLSFVCSDCRLTVDNGVSLGFHCSKAVLPETRDHDVAAGDTT